MIYQTKNKNGDLSDFSSNNLEDEIECNNWEIATEDDLLSGEFEVS